MDLTQDVENIEYGDVFNIADAYEIPASVTIELCTKCNIRCKHCYIPDHGHAELSFETIHQIFLQLRQLGTFEIVLTGGEIFCRKDILDIIEMARGLGFDVIVFSNATLLNEKIVKRLSKAYISMFSTSIYSMNEAIHDGITGQAGSLAVTLGGISLLKQYGIPVEVKTMLMKDNYEDLWDIYEYCMNNGHGCVASPFIFCQSDKNKYPLNFRIGTKELQGIIPLINQIVDFSPQRRKKDDYMCPSIRHSFGIDANGDIYPCNAMFYKVGNVFESSLKDVWLSDKLREIRNLTLQDVYECNGCKISSYCVRCAGIALGENGNMLSKLDFACEVARLRYLQAQ